MNIKSVDKIDGIKVGNPSIVQQVTSAVELAHSVSTTLRVQGAALNRVAVSSAVHAANALLALANAQCTRAAPPANIDIIPDTTGALIYCCEHATPHKWKLDGTPL